jgi:hypothetical protein
MFTLRCTERLRTRLGARAKADLALPAIAPTTTLGDWYANLVHAGRTQLVLAISERTFLPVVVPAAPVATLVPRFRAAALLELADVHRDEPRSRRPPEAPISAEQLAAEARAMDDGRIGKTANRTVLGILTDFSDLLVAYLEEHPLPKVAKILATTPCSPFYKHATLGSPELVTRALFRGEEIPQQWLVSTGR